MYVQCAICMRGRSSVANMWAGLQSIIDIKTHTNKPFTMFIIRFSCASFWSSRMSDVTPAAPVMLISACFNLHCFVLGTNIIQSPVLVVRIIHSHPPEIPLRTSLILFLFLLFAGLRYMASMQCITHSQTLNAPKCKNRISTKKAN